MAADSSDSLSRFAIRGPIGLAEVIETAPPEQLAGSYKKWL
jgi:hypothetical protein